MRYSLHKTKFPVGLQALPSGKYFNVCLFERHSVMDIPSTNGAFPPGRGAVADAHGRAGLLLTESLMHCLVEKGVISREDFIGIVDAAAEVECMPASANGSSDDDQVNSLLYPLANAFRRELGE
jgi:hypothetical protein